MRELVIRIRRSMQRGYLSGGVVALFSICLAGTVMAQDTTTVYKVVNPDGTVTFSDQPADNAERLDVPPVSTVPAFKAPASSRSATAGTKKTVAKAYDSLAITAPGNNTAFYSGNGDVTISTQLSPALKNGHQYQFLLDGKLMATQAAGSFVMSTVDRGTHTVSVHVIDKKLNSLISDSSTFTIHRPKVSRPSINP